MSGQSSLVPVARPPLWLPGYADLWLPAPFSLADPAPLHNANSTAWSGAGGASATITATTAGSFLIAFAGGSGISSITGGGTWSLLSPAGVNTSVWGCPLATASTTSITINTSGAFSHGIAMIVEFSNSPSSLSANTTGSANGTGTSGNTGAMTPTVRCILLGTVQGTAPGGANIGSYTGIGSLMTFTDAAANTYNVFPGYQIAAPGTYTGTWNTFASGPWAGACAAIVLPVLGRPRVLNVRQAVNRASTY